MKILQQRFIISGTAVLLRAEGFWTRLGGPWKLPLSLTYNSTLRIDSEPMERGLLVEVDLGRTA